MFFIKIIIYLIPSIDFLVISVGGVWDASLRGVKY